MDDNSCDNEQPYLDVRASLPFALSHYSVHREREHPRLDAQISHPSGDDLVLDRADPTWQSRVQLLLWMESCGLFAPGGVFGAPVLWVDKQGPLNGLHARD